MFSRSNDGSVRTTIVRWQAVWPSRLRPERIHQYPTVDAETSPHGGASAEWRSRPSQKNSRFRNGISQTPLRQSVLALLSECSNFITSRTKWRPPRSGAPRSRKAATERCETRQTSIGSYDDLPAADSRVIWTTTAAAISLYTVATGVTGEPTAPGSVSGGAVNKNRLRSFCLSHSASSPSRHNSPRCMPFLNKQCWCKGNMA